MDSKNVYISNGRRPLWHIILAAFFFTASFFLLYLICFENNIVSHKRDYGGLSYMITFGFMMGIRFSQVIDYQFDFQKMQYKKIYTFGFIKFSSKFSFQDLKYIAVFKKEELQYEINLWHGKNKRFNISIYKESKEALLNARYIAEKLSLDIWDATNPHNADWLDTDNLLELE